MTLSRASDWALSITALLIAMALAIRSLAPPQREFGDGRDYILQTQAIVFDRALSIDPASRGEYWNRTNPFGLTLPLPAVPSTTVDGFSRPHIQCAPGFGSLYQAKDGTFRFAHTWVYSLVVAPFYALMHVLSSGPAEYLAFRFFNILLIFTPLFLLFRLNPSWGALGFLTLVLVSPLTPHMQWAHTELFCFSAVLTAFVSLKYPRLRWWGPVMLGLGAAQNIPIALLFPLHMWLRLREEGTLGPSVVARIGLSYLIGVALPALVMAHYYHYFGTFNLIATIGGAHTSQITAHRMRSVFLSPLIGVLWYFPAAWFAVVLSWRKPHRLTVLLACVSVVAVAMLCSATTNINSAQLSAPRYALWFLAPLYYLPFACRELKGRARFLPFNQRTCVALLCVVGVLLWLHTHQFIQGEWEAFYSLNRANSRVAKIYRWTHFDDDIEPLVENIQVREMMLPLSFSGVYIWELGREQSVWIVSKRAWLRARSFTIAGDIKRLETSDALRQIFTMERENDGTLRAIPKREVSFRSHPYWGSYLIIWVHGDIVSVSASPTVSVEIKGDPVRSGE